MENAGDLGGRKKKGKESVGSVGADRGYLENSQGVEREAQSAQILSKNCRKNMPPLLRLMFCISVVDSPSGGPMREE